MKYRIIGPSTLQAVTRDQVKAQARIDGDHDDAQVDRLIAAALSHVERFIGRPLLAATFEGVLDRFPRAEIEIPVAPVLGVDELAYVDRTGQLQIVPAAGYTVDGYGERGWIVPHQGVAWPSPMATINAVRVRWTAGFGATPEAVPASLIEAVIQLAAWWYDQRDAAILDGSVREAPFGVAELLREYRGWSFG